jgi:hypothetical protein
MIEGFEARRRREAPMMKSPGGTLGIRKAAVIGVVVLASCALEWCLFVFAACGARSGVDGNYVFSDAVILFVFLNAMIFLPVLGIVEMAGKYWTHRRMRQQGRESVSGWCDLERTSTTHTVRAGGAEILDHPMRDRFLDG